ncbi:NAD-dependent epimerase/dehydratase family protein [Halomonas korlensis]|uniref:UDP-glucose 4-epimerase n=1 Tax=Halomonas korlensis TaxID=463301 RepID=A0A1I7FCL7_9GAMM|nr:SDR family oxidoreductase [Halomonas korlensis]SFU33826.1 UDP-glucose 4-epimerase [Halomonas korlensis]
MKILVIGNMGYVGPSVIKELARQHPEAILHGYDNAYFAHCLTGIDTLPERHLQKQYFGDVRNLPEGMLEGYTGVVQLAAVSNDPMGNRFESVTREINQEATVRIAEQAARENVSNFVFASSCSVYGVASGDPRKETDPLSPMTAYARSKIGSEEALADIEGDMVITSLRFATACGMSERLRLDLVLNDFVACALSQKKITVLSDGSPWRPLIDVSDMARAIDWAIQRKASNGGRLLNINTGSNQRNHQVRDLAETVASVIPGTSVSINEAAAVDSRSYKVDFSLFEELAPDHQPQMTLRDSIQGLVEGLSKMEFADTDFRDSHLMRLHVLQAHVDQGRLTQALRWTEQ